ncbi:MAG TPA: TlpA disulfide reductase family protein [Chitinophagaceae bacterium]|nr:TlpA disulfide reductase family protein [Chitinophagaceae bacterium]
MNKTITFFSIVIAITIKSAAQEIKIGQQCPDIEIQNASNFSSPSLKFSQFKDKLIILDFWSTGCKPCIAAFPKIDSMQKKFKSNVQFILVSEEKEEKINNFFATRKKIYKPGVPFITGDSVLTKLFPHVGVPHYVWIEASSGIVVAIPEYYNFNEENILQFLATGKTNLQEKVRHRTNDVDVRYLSQLSDSAFSRINYYSYIIPAVDTITPSFRQLKKMNGSAIPNKIHCNGASIKSLYMVAFTEDHKIDYTEEEVILEVKDPSRYEYPKDKKLWDTWEKDNAYLYDLLVPPAKASQLYKIMRQDLDMIFNVDTRIEKRKMKCWVLTRISDIDKLGSRGDRNGVAFRKAPEDSLWCFWNRPAWFLPLKLKEILHFHKFKSPFHDATGYTGNIDICINANHLDSLDIELLRKDLHKYDLDLVEKEWEHEVIVIREKNKEVSIRK